MIGYVLLKKLAGVYEFKVPVGLISVERRSLLDLYDLEVSDHVRMNTSVQLT